MAAPRRRKIASTTTKAADTAPSTVDTIVTPDAGEEYPFPTCDDADVKVDPTVKDATKGSETPKASATTVQLYDIPTGLSSVTLEIDSKGAIKPKVTVEHTSARTAASTAKTIFDDLLSRYVPSATPAQEAKAA